MTPYGTVSSEYEANGWQKKRTLENGATTDYAYNPVGMMTSLINKNSSGTTIAKWESFAYDGVFNLVSQDCTTHTEPEFEGYTEFTYDVGNTNQPNRDRLVEESSNRFAGIYNGYSESSEFDNAGNPVKFRDPNTTISYNSNNQRTGTGYTYDGNGNPTTYKTKTATFDEENRLKSLNISSLSYGYRSDGLRAWRQRTLSGTTEKRYYLYDQGNAIMEIDANGNVKAVNVFAPDGLASRHWGTSSHHYYVFDWQGNVSQSLYSGTAIRRNYAYNAWGAVNYTTPDYYVDSDWDQIWQYNARWGYQRDTVAGLYYCQQRYYDPATGRWVTRDPIGHSGGVNIYGYCRGGPVTSVDPTGLMNLDPISNALLECIAAQLKLTAAYDALNAALEAYNPYLDANPWPWQIRFKGEPSAPGKYFPGGHVRDKLPQLSRRIENAKDAVDRACGPPPPPRGSDLPVSKPCPTNEEADAADRLQEKVNEAEYMEKGLLERLEGWESGPAPLPRWWPRWIPRPVRVR